MYIYSYFVSYIIMLMRALAHVLAYNKAVKTYGSNLVFATFSTYSARKGTTFFSIHKRLHTKKTQNMLQNILLTALLLEVRPLRC